jgi:hypothetical protein
MRAPAGVQSTTVGSGIYDTDFPPPAAPECLQLPPQPHLGVPSQPVAIAKLGYALFAFPSRFVLFCIIMNINICNRKIWSRGSSVSILSDYRLDDRDSIPDRGKGFFL